jgi:hypothetical protein
VRGATSSRKTPSTRSVVPRTVSASPGCRSAARASTRCASGSTAARSPPAD